MDPGSWLAFVDVETNGLSPVENRIAEIGVVTVDGDRVERWTTLVKGGCDARLDGEQRRDVPAFRDIAPALAQRLEGRLLVAHNARFDYAFLRAEFERAGIVFEAPVLCSVMLSRKLRPHLAHHDLDSLAMHHGLRVEERHRALPDADLVWQWWRQLCCEFEDAAVARAVDELLAGPVLPARLDPALIEALPSAPGAYVLHGEDGRALVSVHWPLRIAPDVTWSFVPDAVPCIDVMSIDACRVPDHAESFGVFASERKARNALDRLASRRGLCRAMLGLAGECAACEGSGCGSAISRKKHLLRVFDAIRPIRVEAWPYAGAIGIRERGDLHVVDGWQFLGTARNDGEAHDLVATHRAGFDKRMYKLLQRELAHLAPGKIVDLSAGRREAVTERVEALRRC